MRFLFVDRIVQLSPGEWIRGIKHITQDDAYLCYDDTGRLCFIPSLIGETLGQLAAWNVMSHNGFSLRPVAGVVASAKVYRPAYVGETLALESFIERLDDTAVQYHSVARINNEIIFTVDGALGPLLPMAEFIDEQTIRAQFLEINRPGEWPLNDVFAIEGKSITTEISPRIPKLTFDRIINSEPGVALVAEKRITAAAPYFPDHFPRKPVLPMTVLLECKLNLAREFAARAQLTNYQVSELRKIKMNEFVHPGDVVVCHVKVKQQDSQELILSYRSEVDGKRVCVLDVIMTAKGKNDEK